MAKLLIYSTKQNESCFAILSIHTVCGVQDRSERQHLLNHNQSQTSLNCQIKQSRTGLVVTWDVLRKSVIFFTNVRTGQVVICFKCYKCVSAEDILYPNTCKTEETVPV